MAIPRTIDQAHALCYFKNLGIDLDGVINIELILVYSQRRLVEKLFTVKQARASHKVFNPPVNYNEEDYYQREDDKPRVAPFGCKYRFQGEPIFSTTED